MLDTATNGINFLEKINEKLMCFKSKWFKLNIAFLAQKLAQEVFSLRILWTRHSNLIDELQVINTGII